MQSPNIKIQDSVQLQLRAESLVPLLTCSKWQSSTENNKIVFYPWVAESIVIKKFWAPILCQVSMMQCMSMITPNVCSEPIMRQKLCNYHFIDVKTEAKKG